MGATLVQLGEVEDGIGYLQSALEVTGSALADSNHPPQEEAGPQGPRWLMKVRKGFLEVDPPLHQPKKKEKQ